VILCFCRSIVASYICRFSLCTMTIRSDILYLCFLLVDAQERSRLVESRSRSWVSLIYSGFSTYLFYASVSMCQSSLISFIISLFGLQNLCPNSCTSYDHSCHQNCQLLLLMLTTWNRNHRIVFGERCLLPSGHNVFLRHSNSIPSWHQICYMGSLFHVVDHY